ncbi:MAG: Two component regulator three Y domain-containing protein [Flavobacteriaceae bacterium]|nr:Two component regulator three Y domain-containing protein [Flavobacteriaceae bacterium]
MGAISVLQSSKSLIVFIILWGPLGYHVLFCQTLYPPIYNYSSLDYGAGNKNWGLALNEKGELFVANNRGLLHFNGVTWSLHELPNKTIVRSVVVKGDSIFTGSYEEFGFWIKESNGDLKYSSLTHLINDYQFTSEEFWEILPIGNTIYFRSFSAIYEFKNGKIRVLNPPLIISDFINFNKKLYVATNSKGLFKVENNEIIPLKNQDLLLDKNVTDIIRYHEGLLVGTKLEGCFFYDGKNLKPWNNPLNEELKKNQLNKILNLGQGKLVFGTIKNGIYLYDHQSDKEKNINKESGLLNNTVLSLLKFKDQLWLGLDNGLTRVRLNYPINYYSDNSGALGMVYDITPFEDKIYLGSNTGVFFIEGEELKFVNNSQGHVWDLQILEDDLLCGHNTGTYKIQGDSFKKISDISGGYQFQKVPEEVNLFIQGTYTGLARFQKQESDNWAVSRVKGVDFPIKQLAFENKETLWGVHSYKGIYRMKMSKSYDSIINIQSYDRNDDIPSEYNIKVYNIKNQIVINSDGQWLKYDPILDEIITFEGFQGFKGKELLHFKDDQYWFIDHELNNEILYTNLDSDKSLISDIPLSERLSLDSQSMSQINDSIFYITLEDGFAQVNHFHLLKRVPQTPIAPEIVTIHYESNASSIFSRPLKIPYRNSKTITCEVATPELIRPRYRYRLIGPVAKSGYIENGTIEFQGLPKGKYTLSITIVGINNKVSNPRMIEFKILPPWSLSNLMVILYILFGLVAFVLTHFIYQRKRKRKLQLKVKKEQDEKQLEIEKEKLTREIRLKQNKLTESTFYIAKKNELIQDIKNMLVMNEDKFSNSIRYRSFIKKLNNSIHDTDDWKRFEMNFKELHGDFFERLLHSYPSLTPKDLTLCAYLKMNLSTKEIAPLMAITIRGVEIHRYRLRKKLNIDKTKNLSKFLIMF